MANDNTAQLSKKELSALASLTEEMAREINLQKLLRKILLLSGEFVESTQGSIILLDPSANSLFFAAATGNSAELILEKWGQYGAERIPIHGSIAGKVLQTRAPLIVCRPADYFTAVDMASGNRTSSIICVPLLVSGECIGVMQFINKAQAQFTNKDTFVLGHFANICAVYIRNVQYITELTAYLGFTSVSDEKQSVPQIMAALSQPAVKEELSLIFCDIRGFSRMSILLNDPRELHDKLQQYLSLVADQVVLHNGHINKIAGDGVLAFFAEDNHEIDAVRCSQTIATEFAALANDWTCGNGALSFVDIGIGITTDSVTRGTIRGRNFRDYSVTGPAVNMVAALEKKARDGRRILLDQKTYLAAQQIIAEVEGPISYRDTKSGPSTIVQDIYHLKALKPLLPGKIF